MINSVGRDRTDFTNLTDFELLCKYSEYILCNNNKVIDVNFKGLYPQEYQHIAIEVVTTFCTVCPSYKG